MNSCLRLNAFETNSSSSHSISLSKDDNLNLDCKNLLNKDGDLIIFTGEYGWEFAEYTDFNTKLSYLVTGIIQSSSGNIHSPEMDMLFEILREVTSCNNIIIEPNDGSYGYIDHQSCDVYRDALESREALKKFLFNPKSILRTGNDNC